MKKLPKMKIDPMWPPTSITLRVASKIVAESILNCGGGSVQCSGEKNWDIGEDRADIQVPMTQIAQWILRNAGYSLCEADLLELVDK